mgnify:FL=1
MAQKNILKEVSELIKSTNDTINFVISKRSTDYVELLKSIHTTLANVEQLLKRESEAQQEERTELLKAFNLEKSCKNQAYFFILEKGHLDEYQHYCSENPRENF